MGDATDLQFLEDVEIPDVAQQLEVLRSWQVSSTRKGRMKEWHGGTGCGRLSRIEKTEGARVDQELKAFLEEMKAGMDERFVRLGARMDERFEKVETEGRQTRVLLEGMHDNIRLLAEGIMGVTERLEAHQAATARGFQEVKEMLSPYYRNLNGRTQSLEDDVQAWIAA